MSEQPVTILTVNGGSSSIKFAIFSAAAELVRQISGIAERIGSKDAAFVVKDAAGAVIERGSIEGATYDDAADHIANWIADRLRGSMLLGIGHRIVHGGVTLVEHQRVMDAVIAALRAAQPLDLAHLPGEIALLELFRRRFDSVPQVACFDTVFHRALPRVAKLLPIPRRYDDAGVRRMGFHGLSYTFLMSELRRTSAAAAEGRVILAHLGSGASMVAVKGGQPVDTSMGFTPAAGLVMGTRPGDMDPGLLLYLMRREKLTPEQMDEFVNRRCGLAGVSETVSDMRDLIARRDTDVRAAEAVELFCYQAKKFIGAYAAALGGLDTIVFAGGIGEHSPEVREDICRGLEFLGVRIDPGQNNQSAAIISADDSRVTIRVIPTDEEVVIARSVCSILQGPIP